MAYTARLRKARNVHFISSLTESGVEFVAVTSRKRRILPDVFRPAF
jgi:hypothetical protein